MTEYPLLPRSRAQSARSRGVLNIVMAELAASGASGHVRVATSTPGNSNAIRSSVTWLLVVAATGRQLDAATGKQLADAAAGIMPFAGCSLFAWSAGLQVPGVLQVPASGGTRRSLACPIMSRTGVSTGAGRPDRGPTFLMRPHASICRRSPPRSSTFSRIEPRFSFFSSIAKESITMF